MIAPLKQPTHKKTIKLLPQDKERAHNFCGRFAATQNAIEKFGEAVIVPAYTVLLKEVR